MSIHNTFMDGQNLLTKVKDAAANGTSTLTTDSVDMLDYTGCVFFSSYATAASGNNCKAQQSSDDGVADGFSDLLGTLVGVSTSDEDVWVEIHKPEKRYVRALFLRGTSSVMGDIWCLRYGKVRGETAADNTIAGTIHGEVHKTPLEGTA